VREGSNAEEAMGENSVVMVKIPSKGESSYGFVIVAEVWTSTLGIVSM